MLIEMYEWNLWIPVTLYFQMCCCDAWVCSVVLSKCCCVSSCLILSISLHTTFCLCCYCWLWMLDNAVGGAVRGRHCAEPSSPTRTAATLPGKLFSPAFQCCSNHISKWCSDAMWVLCVSSVTVCYCHIHSVVEVPVATVTQLHMKLNRMTFLVTQKWVSLYLLF